MVKLAIYFDESYTHRTEKEPDIPRIYTVGGYLSSVQQWTAFQKEWHKTLKKAGIEYFHMANFESRFGIFENWANEKRIDFLQALHKIIHKYVLKGFTTSIVLNDFDDLTAEQKYAFRDNAYVCAFGSCLKHISKVYNEFDLIQSIDYVFEDGSGFNGKINAFVEELPDEAKKAYRIGSISFEKKDCLPLNASDILVYEVTKELANQKNNRKRPTRKSIRNLALSRIDEWIYMETEHFRKMLMDAKELGFYEGEI